MVATRKNKLNIQKGKDSKYPEFRVDAVNLLGCPMKRGFDWGRFPNTEVNLFISKNDIVVYMARLYGMGAAGRYGFKKRTHNLTQGTYEYGHSGFMSIYTTIKRAIETDIRYFSCKNL
jgi:hypothetical protein